MKRSRTSLIAIVTIAILGVLATLVFSWRPQLGLDLQGGASVVLQPTKKVDSAKLEQTIEIIRNRVDGLGVSEPEISRQGDAIVVQLPGVKDQAKALEIVGQTAELRFRPVLAEIDSEEEYAQKQKLEAATPSTTVKPGTTAAPTTTAPAAGSATTTSTIKVTASIAVPTTAAPGQADEAAIGVSGGGRLATGVSAGVVSSTAATATTAASATTKPAPASGATVTTVKGGVVTSAPLVTVKPGPSIPAGPVTPPITAETPQQVDLPADLSKSTSIEENDATKTVVLPNLTRSKTARRYILGPAELKGNVVSDASAQPPQGVGSWMVDIEFNKAGSKQWDDMARKYYCPDGGANCTRVAVELDGVVLSAPTINAQEFNGRAQISGSFTSASARNLATSLRYGSLPVRLEPATVQTVSATLGRDSLRAGLLTGGLGIALVCSYMIFYYRKLGLIVVAGLLLSGALTWTIISFLGAKSGLALSLSGAVGIIVSVGITVDSYVVYFERMRDEMRGGKTLAASVDKAFLGAWRTILSADLTSLIGALTLYFLTVGSVRGFAFFLAMSTTLDMVVSYFFTRPLVSWLAARGSFGGGGVSRTPGGVLKPSATVAAGTLGGSK
jgi:preprotein translocase subunit SecD